MTQEERFGHSVGHGVHGVTFPGTFITDAKGIIQTKSGHHHEGAGPDPDAGAGSRIAVLAARMFLRTSARGRYPPASNVRSGLSVAHKRPGFALVGDTGAGGAQEPGAKESFAAFLKIKENGG